MAVQALRRGILNQHVLLEVSAFAGIVGGVIGLAWPSPLYPTGKFFAVSVMVATYHIFSEWLSLIVKTRSSQAVKRLLALQPDTARVVRDHGEVDVAVGDVMVGDLVPIRPGERIPVDGTVISELLAIAAAAESSSEHPLATAVMAAAFAREVVPPTVESFEARPGRGVVALIGGRDVCIRGGGGGGETAGRRGRGSRAPPGRAPTAWGWERSPAW